MVAFRRRTTLSTAHHNNNNAPSLILLLLAVFLVCGWDPNNQIHAFVAPVQQQQIHLPAAILVVPTPIFSSSSKLHLFKTLDRVINQGKVAEEVHNSGDSAVAINGRRNDNAATIPFVIERLRRPSDEVFREIAEMCIAVFFNDGKTGRAMPPWKEVQLVYLRALQMADLRRRRRRDTNTNAMFVAYKVEEASFNAALSKPLILDLRGVFNLKSLAGAFDQNNNDYVRTDVLGFCEVTMVPFGLGAARPSNPQSLVATSLTDSNGNYYIEGDNSPNGIPPASEAPARTNYANRPVLTNLSVDMKARKSGVGSKLVEACERAVSREWGKQEIVLEVEDENALALSWYQKRGYRALFSDESSKRYDVSGLVVKKVRCTRRVMRKSLNSIMPSSTDSNSGSAAKSPFDSFGGALKRLRENMMQATN